MAYELYLGRAYDRDGTTTLYRLKKHSWDCGWYWGFGYIGDRNLHTHFDSVFLRGETDIKKIFKDTVFSQDQWWILRDLFIQAYALRRCAEVYRYGGHQTSKAFRFGDKKMEDRINADLKIILDKIWDLVEYANKEREVINNI